MEQPILAEEGYFVCGARVKYMNERGWYADDTAVEGLEFKICKKSNWHDQKALMIQDS